MDAFWPGPLTLILPRQPEVPDNVTAGLDTVGVRMPDHPVALALLRISGLPVAAPSANRSGRPSPTTAGHVLEDLEGRIAAIIDGGLTGVGVESTVLDVTVDPPMILRPGGVTKEMLEQVIGKVNIDPTLTEQRRMELAPRSPGMKYTHYAPQGEMWIVEGDWDLPTNLEPRVQAGKGMDKQADKQADLLQGLVDRAQAEGYKTGVLTTDERLNRYQADVVLSCGLRHQLESIAAGLYHALREFDRLGIERIYAESFPEDGIGFAIMNRLRKAAGYRVIG
jgi:L-threonylcarbamoyladenylate synthase